MLPLGKCSSQGTYRASQSEVLTIKGLLSTIIPCASEEKQEKENLGQKRLGNRKVESGAAKDHG